MNASVLRLTAAVFVAAVACSPSDGRDGRDTTISTAALQPAMAAITGESILEHTNRLAGAGEAQHHLGKITARSAHSARAEHAGGSNDQRLLQVRLRVKLAGEFGYRIST